MHHEFLHYNAEVLDAIKHQLPIVVLDSTSLSHGLPYPDNFTSAKLIEDIVRDANAIPATIALHQGKIHIGLDSSLMEHLACNKTITQAAKNDIAFYLSQKITASTTVAATMFCANLANLPIVVTGGIGGMDYQTNQCFDSSADLLELSSTPVTIICSGAKSILDLPKTLDLLERQGVGVIGFGTNQFPAFYSHSHGFPLIHRLDNAEDIAHLMHCQHKLTMNHGLVIANPIPKSAEIADSQLMPIIEQAQRDTSNSKEKTITPVLLQRITELTTSQHLHANNELIKNNALLGSKIAIEYNKTLWLEKKFK